MISDGNHIIFDTEPPQDTPEPSAIEPGTWIDWDGRLYRAMGYALKPAPGAAGGVVPLCRPDQWNKVVDDEGNDDADWYAPANEVAVVDEESALARWKDVLAARAARRAGGL